MTPQQKTALLDHGHGHKWLGAGYVHISNAGLQRDSHHCKGKLMLLSLSEVISN